MEMSTNETPKVNAGRTPYTAASTEPLEIIRANECENDVGSLSTARFRRLFNELDAAMQPAPADSALVAAAQFAQRVLASLTDTATIQTTTVVNAYAQVREAELALRQALAGASKVGGNGNG